jgi:hypothetical protein
VVVANARLVTKVQAAAVVAAVHSALHQRRRSRSAQLGSCSRQVGMAVTGRRESVAARVAAVVLAVSSTLLRPR